MEKMASAWVLLLLLALLAVCGCGWAQQAGAGLGPAGADKEFQEFVAKHNIQLSDQPLPHNCLELWGQLFDENVQTGKWLVLFAAPWSSESRRMQSIWEEFTQQGQRQYPWLKFARVRCDLEKSLCNDRLMLTKFPFIVGLDEGNATVMREAESNAGLHEFVTTGWARRGPGEPLPPHPHPLHLRYKRFMHGLEQVLLQVPGGSYPLVATAAIAVCAALLVLLTCYSLCGTAAAPHTRGREEPATGSKRRPSAHHQQQQQPKKNGAAAAQLNSNTGSSSSSSKNKTKKNKKNRPKVE